MEALRNVLRALLVALACAAALGITAPAWADHGSARRVGCVTGETVTADVDEEVTTETAPIPICPRPPLQQPPRPQPVAGHAGVGGRGTPTRIDAGARGADVQAGAGPSAALWVFAVAGATAATAMTSRRR